MNARRSLVAAGGVLACAALAFAVFGPGPNSVVVPSTSQLLSATITAPPDASTVPIPPGTVQVTGNCAITPPQGNCNQGTTINVLYVLDLSGSTDLNFMQQNGIPLVDANGNGMAGDAGDDLNADGEAGDILDGEISGVLALHASIGNPAGVNVGVVAFATAASAADVDPALPNSGGITQVYTNPPQANRDSLNGADIPEVLRSLDSNFNTPAGGLIGKFTVVPRSTLGSGTQFPPALAAMNNALDLFPPGKNVVFFLSDGESNAGFRCIDGSMPCDADLDEAVTECTTINTIGVGAEADPVDLTFISNTTGGIYTQVTDPSDLSTLLPLITPAGLDRVEVNGMQEPLDVLGNFSKIFVCPGPGPLTVTATCFADDPADTSVSADITVNCVLLCGNGVVDLGAGEECDPPNTPTCDATCQRVPMCGDSFIDTPEVCDPPNGTTCDVDCTLIECGNGSVESGEECEPPSTPTCDATCQRVSMCGDGFIDAPEVCDPPDGSTCAGDCTLIVCGDLVIEGQEECDPPHPLTCDSGCQRIPSCGDGFVDAPETCEPPSTPTCNAVCDSIVCGDGVVEGLEQCEPPSTPTCDDLCLNIACPDADQDGVCDSEDNCPGEPNPDQEDADGDGIGDACDQCTDTDGDGFGDPGFPSNTCPPDDCPEEPDPDQSDLDGDGLGDVCDQIDAPLNVISLRLNSPAALKGKIVAKGDFVVPLGPGEAIYDFFNANDGIAVRVKDSRFLDESFGWPSTECFTQFRPDGSLKRIKCTSPDRRLCCALQAV